MSPTRLREILDALHWSQRDLADLLSCNERLVRRWAAGQAEVPAKIAYWLGSRMLEHQTNPPPAEWRSRELVQPDGSVRFREDPDDFEAANPARLRPAVIS